jgi:hypothetical protein
LYIIGAMRRTISGVVDTANVDEDEVVGSEKFSLLGLPAVEDFGGHEGFEVLVVGKDLEGMSGSFKVVAPVLHTLDDGKHFPVGNIVVAFCREAFCGSNRQQGARTSCEAG